MPDIVAGTIFQLTITEGLTEYICECEILSVRENSIVQTAHPQIMTAYPVGDSAYPPEKWYAAVVHDPTGKRNNGYKHTGIDLNLDIPPRGDIERVKNLGIYSIGHGVVTYRTDKWSGVPMIVIEHQYRGKPLYTRYAHLIPVVEVGDKVEPGQLLGTFANWTKNDGGDHLHLDMATEPFTTEWLYNQRIINWVDPVPILKDILDPDIIDKMLQQGD